VRKPEYWNICLKLRKIFRKVYKNNLVKVNELDNLISTDKTTKFIEKRLSVYLDIVLGNMAEMSQEKRVNFQNLKKMIDSIDENFS